MLLYPFRIKKIELLVLLFLLLAWYPCEGSSSRKSIKLANTLYQRLNGVPLLPAHPLSSEISKLIANGDWASAAALASDEDHFFDLIIRNFASRMSNRKESLFVPLSDFETLIIGVVRDNLDSRSLLTGNFRYEAKPELGIVPPSHKNNFHYLELQKRGLSLRRNLIKTSPQWNFRPGVEAAGLLTTYQWASEHLLAGTNRRATEFALREFLCAPKEQWKDVSTPDFHVRRDITRSPGGNPDTYQTDCRGCHGILDGLTGAFANFDFVDGEVRTGNNWIAPKMNQNSHFYPAGAIVIDKSWVNLATSGHNEVLGWKTEPEGVGITAFGHMLSRSRAFSRCMARRAYVTVCREELTESVLVEKFADEFEQQGYRLRIMFEKAAIHCTKGN